jgi:ubiquinone biosynthesis protein COQ4
MAGDMGKPDYEKLDREYMEGKARPLSDYGSVLMTSSKFLNSARMRDVYAQEGLRKVGHDVPPTYMVHQAAMTFAELTDEAEVEALLVKEKGRYAEFAAWLDRRSLADFTIAELSAYKPDSLGGIVHEYLTRTGFDLNHSKRGLQPTSDHSYMQKQRVVGHDIEHIVTGLLPNPLGEYALISCNLATYYKFFSPDFASEMTRMSGFLLSTGTMKLNLHYPALMGEFLNANRIGIEMGQGMTKPLLIADWRAYLDWTIADIREELNILGSPPAGTWDWTNQARRG